MQRLRREILVWSRLHHENINSLLGITTDFISNASIGLVSLWFKNNLNTYLAQMTNVLPLTSRFQIVSHFLPSAVKPLGRRHIGLACRRCIRRELSFVIITFLVTAVTEFLLVHSQGVIHGDLSGANILISQEGKACITDYGFSSIGAEFEGTSYFSSTVGGSMCV